MDEKKTEASAATAVIVEIMAIPVKYREMIIDRPFLFIIKDNETGAFLFAGRVSDPLSN